MASCKIQCTPMQFLDSFGYPSVQLSNCRAICVVREEESSICGNGAVRRMPSVKEPSASRLPPSAWIRGWRLTSQSSSLAGRFDRRGFFQGVCSTPVPGTLVWPTHWGWPDDARSRQPSSAPRFPRMKPWNGRVACRLSQAMPHNLSLTHVMGKFHRYMYSTQGR